MRARLQPPSMSMRSCGQASATADSATERSLVLLCRLRICTEIGGLPQHNHSVMLMMMSLHLFQPHQANQIFDPTWVHLDTLISVTSRSNWCKHLAAPSMSGPIIGCARPSPGSLWLGTSVRCSRLQSSCCWSLHDRLREDPQPELQVLSGAAGSALRQDIRLLLAPVSQVQMREGHHAQAGALASSSIQGSVQALVGHLEAAHKADSLYSRAGTCM